MNILLFGTLAAGVALALAGLGLRSLFVEPGARRVASLAQDMGCRTVLGLSG